MTRPAPSRNLRLYGTEELPAEERLLQAGPLTALFDGANLRDIRMHGEEVIRAVSFIVRDKDWATLIPRLSELSVEETEGAFRISYRAETEAGAERFGYEARIEGSAEGVLSFSGHGNSDTGLLTNRTGFVVLHPIEGVAGHPARITHTDGSVVDTRFPAEIDPVQPMMDLREIVHWTPGGQEVSCRMEGDAYEMEDQRNWTDASYKTYVRPLALPWPYRIEPGEEVDQKITLTVRGDAPARATAGAGPVEPKLGEMLARVPPLGLGLQPEDARAALDHAPRLADLGAAYLVCRHDPRLGHDAASLARQIEVARAMGAEPWLEAVIAQVDDAGAAAEVAALGELAATMGQPFATVLVSPAPDLKCTLPGSVWPPAPDAARLYQATRAAFPDARIGGGMFSFFTELNRKRPPTEALDLVTFTTAAIFHAGDDRSMMETLETLPHITRTVPAIAKGLPWAVGPSAIALRDNPYGEAPVANPGNIRQAVNFNDPRQRGVMGAAWTLGYFAAMAAGGASAIALGGAVGAFGVLSVPTAFPQPWYEGPGELYPLWHVLRGLARLRGYPMAMVETPGGALRGLAAETDAGTELWLCNTGPQPRQVQLPSGFSQAAVLDAAAFARAAEVPDLMDELSPVAAGGMELDAFAVVRAIAER